MPKFIKIILEIIAIIVGIWILITIIALIYNAAVEKPKDEFWGVTFLIDPTQDLGLDWKQTYLSILDDLKPRALRLSAQWDKIEPTKRKWDFTDLDWQIDQANKRQIPFIIAFGQKTPGWPECHVPNWANKDPDKNLELFIYEINVIERYKKEANLLYWQVENEPLVKFGICSKPDKDLLRKEVLLTNFLDNHKILVTDGERVTLWTKANKYADVLGVALYRKMGFRGKTYTIPELPQYFTLKAKLTNLLSGFNNQVIIIEVGLKPWGSSFDEKEFDDVVNFAKKTKFGTYYAWGAEWWYYQKVNGNDAFWRKAKELFKKY